MHKSHAWRLLPLLLLAYILQTTWLAGPFLGLARPDLPFLVALCAALLGGAEIGAIVGVGAGLLGGMGAAWHVGSFLVSRTLPPALLGWLSPRFSIFHPFAPPLCAFAATLLQDGFFLMMSPADFPVAWWVRHAIATGVVHALLIWPVFGVLRWAIKPPQHSLFA